MGKALSPAERAKLARVLGMLGSSHDGERASAALLANRIVQAAGITWAEVLEPEPIKLPEAPQSSDWFYGADDLSLALRHVTLLTSWEQNFVASLSGTLRRSPKQVAVLQKIATSLRSRGCV